MVKYTYDKLKVVFSDESGQNLNLGLRDLVLPPYVLFVELEKHMSADFCAIAHGFGKYFVPFYWS